MLLCSALISSALLCFALLCPSALLSTTWFSACMVVMEQRLYAVAESPAIPSSLITTTPRANSNANVNVIDNPETATTLDATLGLPNDIFSTQNLTFQFPRFMQTPTYDHRLLEWATPIYPPAAAAPPSSMSIFTSSSTPSTMDYHIHYPPHPHPHSHPHPHT